LGAAALWVFPRTANAEPILYAQINDGQVATYNANTGAVINSNFIVDGGIALAFSGKIKNLGNTIFALIPEDINHSPNAPVVSQYSLTRAVINLTFITTGLSNDTNDTGIAVVGNKLFVAYQDNSIFPPSPQCRIPRRYGGLD